MGALDDYQQLLGGYPNAKRFIEALRGNIERNVPTQSDFESPQAMSEWSQAAALNAPMGLAIKAYHGSPHSFDKFDMSKIGTGEGAQSYGHGLYFAQHPKVAEKYIVNAESQKTPEGSAMSYIQDYGSYEKALEGAKNRLNFMKYHDPEQIQFQKDTIKALENKNLGGNLYSVSLEWPDKAREAVDPLSPEHFLDWDKPLMEQSQAIQDAANKYILKNIPENNRFKYLGKNPTGEDFYEALQMMGPREKEDSIAKLTSNSLYELGIPGIRYLDQGSRGAGEGTSNYVVFNDLIPRIVEKLRGQ